MKPERLHQVEQLYHAALEREEAERVPFLRDVCAGDEALRREVESLLAHDKEVADFIESPALEAMAKALAKTPPRADLTSIGPYRLVKKLGEGGMGQVWLAEQTAPIQRQVALKLIKVGMYNDSVLERFYSERQSLAIMDPFHSWKIWVWQPAQRLG